MGKMKRTFTAGTNGSHNANLPLGTLSICITVMSLY